MNKKHVPSLELCQEFDTLCKEKGIVVPETEFYWQTGKPLAGSNLEVTSLFTKDSGQAFVPEELIPAPLVSEQGEWLGKVSGKDFLNSYLEVMDLFIFQIDKVQMSHNLMTDPDIGISMINYLLAEGIITKL